LSKTGIVEGKSSDETKAPGTWEVSPWHQDLLVPQLAFSGILCRQDRRIQMGNTSVSAVIPAYNAELFISEAIQSVLAQTYEIAEIIVVDDGSRDRTAEVSAGFPRTRVIQTPNAGQGAARNTGIDAATGEWIAFLDHDDVWLPQKTEIQLACVAPDTAVVHANRFDPIHFGNLWHRQAHISPSGALVRKQALLDVGGFDESRAIIGVEDLNLWLRIALRGGRFVQSETNLFEWRKTGQNQSENDLRMVRAELTNFDTLGRQLSCPTNEVERMKQASRIEYAKNLIAKKQWDDAAQLLHECAPDSATRWLSMVRVLRQNRLARTNLVRFLQSADGQYRTHKCQGRCSLPEAQRNQCMASSRNAYWCLPMC
jgi:Glycosyl transferase family 2